MSKKSNRKTSYRSAGKIRTVLMLIAVCLVVVMTVSACRPSSVLVEEIYKSIENEIDEEQQQLDPEDEGEEDEQFQDETREDADTERDVEENLGQNDQEETTESADNSVQMNQNDNAGNSDDSSDEATDEETDNTGSSAGNTEDTSEADSADNNEVTDNVSDDENTETSAAESDEQDNEDDGTGDATSNEGGGDSGIYATFTMADARYEEVYVPENIEHVAAVGGAAQFVEMIGGSGKLYITDSVLKSSSIANSVFSDLSGTITAFDGSSCTDFDALITAIEAGMLDVIFVISGDERFTSEQLAVLESYAYTGDEDEDSDGAHVAIIYLYSMYSLDGLKGNAEIMDTVFSKSDKEGATATGAEYVEWVDDIISSVSGYDEKTGLYIAGWDSSASYTLLYGSNYGFESTGTGVAYAYTMQKDDQILTELMEQAGVINSSTGTTSKRVLRTSAIVSDYAYIAPLFKQLGGSITPGGSVDAYYYDYYSNKNAYSYSWAESQEPSVQLYIQEGVYHVLGTANFPAIIAADSGTKAQIEASIFWQNYEASNSQINPYGIKELYQIIYGDYEIYVNPAGMLDWCEGGSVEAPLEMLFIAYVYQGGSDITGDVADFYSTFFGCSDALASSLADEIMAGN